MSFTIDDLALPIDGQGAAGVYTTAEILVYKVEALAEIKEFVYPNFADAKVEYSLSNEFMIHGWLNNGNNISVSHKEQVGFQYSKEPAEYFASLKQALELMEHRIPKVGDAVTISWRTDSKKDSFINPLLYSYGLLKENGPVYNIRRS